MAYNDQAFSYVASQAAQISSVAAALGISTTAIAGAMAEENDAYVTTASSTRNIATQLLLDAYAVSRLNTNAAVVNDYASVYNAGRTDAVVGDLEKLLDPALIDAGPANIKISTAVRLFENYKTDYLNQGTDPLGLGSYTGHYEQLVADLADRNSGVTAAMTGLMIKEAKGFFDTHADTAYWNSLSSNTKDAIYITYFNNGPTAIQKSYDKSVTDGVPYTPAPGDGPSGGTTFLANLAAIQSALANPAQQLSNVPLLNTAAIAQLFQNLTGFAISSMDLLVNEARLLAEAVSSPAYGKSLISSATASLYTTATLVPAPRRDPLVLDLDGDTLKASVYQALLLQTRLKPLLDEVQLNITATGVALDFTALDADLEAQLEAANEAEWRGAA